MRLHEIDNSTTLTSIYQNNFPDRDDAFWDHVGRLDLKKPLTIYTMPPHKIKLLLLSQYGQEHLDDVVDMIDDKDRINILKRYRRAKDLSNQIIVVTDDMIIDGNHRALAAALENKSIKYVNLSDLD